MPVNALAGDTEIPVESAYLQARPLVFDKGTRNQVDEGGAAVLVDGQPVPESYWYLVADLRWWSDDPASGGRRLRANPEQLKLEVDPDAIDGNPIAALYTRLKAEPGFESAVDA